jgi:hypothetical protein
MKICVAGWYFHEPLFKVLDESKYDYRIVAHRNNGKLASDCILVPNVGLEFGCYAHYLNEVWTSDDTLFIHDDIDITKSALNEIAKITCDQCFLFSSKAEADANGLVHGRAFFCSEKLLNHMKSNGGIWYDEGNRGDISPTTAEGPNYHNAGIMIFTSYMQSLSNKFNVLQVGIVPGLRNGYRGRL